MKLFHDADFKILNHQNSSTLLYFHDLFGKFIFHLPREHFNEHEIISIKIKFREKTLCSDEPKCDKNLNFRYFVFNRKTNLDITEL